MQVFDVREQVRVFAVTDEDMDMAIGVAGMIGVPRLGKIDVTWFPNGVPEPRYTESIRGKYVVVVCSIVGDVCRKSMLLKMSVRAARDSHAGHILVVIPYSALWRSDKKDKGGIAAGAKLEAEEIELAGANHVLLCDPHNNMVETLFDAPDTITVQNMLLESAKKWGIQALAAADTGAIKATKTAAGKLGVPYGTSDKTRSGRKDSVDIASVFGVDYRGLVVGILEDEILTGGTIQNVAGWLKDVAGASAVYVMCSHAPFMYIESALSKLSSVTRVITTNTAPMPPMRGELQTMIERDRLEVIDVSSVFGDAVDRIIRGKSFGTLHAFRTLDP